MKKTKLLIIVPSLKAGGAERVLSFLSREINRDRFETLLAVVGFERDNTYEVGENVVFLNKDRLIFAVPKLLTLIFKFDPRIIIGSIVHVNMFLGMLKMFLWNKKIILREASVISKMSTFSSNQFIFSRSLIRFFYKKADMIICQSYDMYNDFRDHYGMDIKQLIVINNPITKLNPSVNELNVKKTDSPVKFITIGRLSEEKGYERILNQLARVSFEFEYTIIGDGPLKEKIFDHINHLGLATKIRHITHTYEVIEHLKSHDLFLQGSYVEGFPNGVLESCTCGTPVLAYFAPGGTNEIVEQAVNGYIAKSDEEYFEILNNPQAYLSLDKTGIIESVRSKFDPEKILSQYECLFGKV